jgi:AcrR family transcriptional regulator
MPVKSAQTPERLAESAFHLFARHGFKKVNLDQIARNASVTKGSLYWHYRSKDDLVKAACNHYYRVYHRRINSELAHITNPVKRLERTLEVAVEICLLDEENRVFTTDIFTLAVHDDELRRSWRQFSDTVREFYIGLLKAAVAAGELTAANPEEAVEFMLSAMEGLKLRAQCEPHLFSPESERSIVASLKRSLGFAYSSP